MAEIVEVFVFARAREGYVLLPEESIEIVKDFEITLVHHGQVRPKLDHLGRAEDQHLPFHVTVCAEH